MPQQQGLPTSICFPLFSTVFAYRALLEDEQLQGLARRTARFGNKPRKRSKTDRTDVSLRQQAIQRLAIARGDAVAIAMASMIDQPDAASLDRTESVIRRMTDIALAQPGVEHAVEFPGLSVNGFVNKPNSGLIFITLKPFAPLPGKHWYVLTVRTQQDEEVGQTLRPLVWQLASGAGLMVAAVAIVFFSTTISLRTR